MTQNMKILIVAVLLAAVAYIVPHTGSFVVLLTTRAMCFAILAMSVDLLLGFTGLSSMGQAAYFGVGAYLTAILATKYHVGLGWDFWLVVILGMLMGAALAALFGLFAMRASGVYFLMITLALGQCVWGLAYRWNSLTGGDNGINVSSRPDFGLDLNNEKTFFFLVFAFFAVSLIVLYVLVRSPFGRSLEGIRERELRMQILGYNTWLHKYIAFIIAGAFGGLAGVLWAHTNGLISPETVVLTTSVDSLLMVVLGGAGTLIGGAILAVDRARGAEAGAPDAPASFTRPHCRERVGAGPVGEFVLPGRRIAEAAERHARRAAAATQPGHPLLQHGDAE